MVTLIGFADHTIQQQRLRYYRGQTKNKQRQQPISYGQLLLPGRRDQRRDVMGDDERPDEKQALEGRYVTT